MQCARHFRGQDLGEPEQPSAPVRGLPAGQGNLRRDTPAQVTAGRPGLGLLPPLGGIKGRSGPGLRGCGCCFEFLQGPDPVNEFSVNQFSVNQFSVNGFSVSQCSVNQFSVGWSGVFPAPAGMTVVLVSQQFNPCLHERGIGSHHSALPAETTEMFEHVFDFIGRENRWEGPTYGSCYLFFEELRRLEAAKHRRQRGIREGSESHKVGCAQLNRVLR